MVMDSGIASRNEETVEFAEANGRVLALKPLLFNYHKIERQIELIGSIPLGLQKL